MSIDLNTATVAELTQLPGISKDIAYRIVNHRKRHGFFTAWQELLEVKTFPAARLEEIKARAMLSCPNSSEPCVPPRHLSKHLDVVRKKPAASTKALRSTRRPDRAKESTGPRH